LEKGFFRYAISKVKVTSNDEMLHRVDDFELKIISKLKGRVK